MNTNALRAAVVGCRMGRAHARAIAELNEYELVAVCDLDEVVAQEAADMLGDVNALRGFEVVMAFYESARLDARLELPLKQERYPLALMA